MNKKKVILTILDGWGLAPKTWHNAIENAQTPNFDRLIRDYPNTALKSDGLSVGLPEGQFGTSEVNHLTIGSGRVIFQDLPKINMAIKNGQFFSNSALVKAMSHVINQKSRLHLMGILSDGGVHSHINHLFALFDMLNLQKFEQPIYLHLFTDGRDVAPKSAAKYFELLDEKIKEYKQLKIKIATLQGRSFLDRDRDWTRTETAFNLISKGEGLPSSGWNAMLNLAYTLHTSDEYLPQYCLDKEGILRNGDGLIIFHYRTDRIYQIIKRILDEDYQNFELASFVQPSEEFSSVNVAFPREKIEETLAETIYKQGLTQLHLAETEKFPHVTYFFNGEREHEFAKEEWKVFTSNRYVKPLYNFEPSMRNFEIAQEITKSVEENAHDFIIANFSSPDMVGHTGNYNAAVVSAEAVDYCLGKLYDVVKDKLDGYAWIITADHGNSEIMWDEVNNQPHTQHTLSKVPFIIVSDLRFRLHTRESLQDIAPTILHLMQLAKPLHMTGESLIIENVL